MPLKERHELLRNPAMQRGFPEVHSCLLTMAITAAAGCELGLSSGARLLARMPQVPLLLAPGSSHIPSAWQNLQELLPCLSG